MRTVILRASGVLASVGLTVAALPSSSTAAVAPAAVGNPEVVTAAAGDRYWGDEIALDGDTMAVGGCRDIAGVCSTTVFVLVRSDGDWVQQAALRPADVPGLDGFGRSVALSGDTVVVGAENPAAGGPADSGSAYVFHRTGDDWSQQAVLGAPDPRSTDDFGFAVAVDGDTLVIGAPGRRVDGMASGATFVYARSAGLWSLQSELTSPVRTSFDEMGAAVAVDGSTVLAGAPSANPGHSDAGKVEVFTRSGSTWLHRSTLAAADGDNNDRLGSDVSLDGDTAAIGTNRMFTGRRERAYVFVGAGASWNVQAKLLCACDDDDFGATVDVSGDTVAVGARLHSPVPGIFSREGSAYVYERSNDRWSKRARLTAPDPLQWDHLYGSDVALDDGRLVVGAARDGDGAMYVYGK